MKRLQIAAAFLAAFLSINAQVPGEYFAPVVWEEAPFGVDWNTDPYPKMNVTIKRAASSLSEDVDIEDFTIDDVKGLWERLGSANGCSKTDPAGGDGTDPDAVIGYYESIHDMAADGSGKFGGSWKAFYNDESLFVFFKFVDDDQIADDYKRWFEIMIQITNPIRYEAGWQAASQLDPPNLKAMNDQYARYIELGGFKLRWQFDEFQADYRINEINANKGQLGQFIDHPFMGLDEWELVSFEDGTDLWFVLELPFDDLVYLEDEWDDNSTLLSMDPAVENVISFEVSSRAQSQNSGADGSNKGEYRGFWNSDVNAVYSLAAYAGLVTLGDEVFYPLSIEKIPNREVTAYVIHETLRFSGLEEPVDVIVYSILGRQELIAENIENDIDLSILKPGVYIIKVPSLQASFKVFK